MSRIANFPDEPWIRNKFNTCLERFPTLLDLDEIARQKPRYVRGDEYLEYGSRKRLEDIFVLVYTKYLHRSELGSQDDKNYVLNNSSRFDQDVYRHAIRHWAWEVANDQMKLP